MVSRQAIAVSIRFKNGLAFSFAAVQPSITSNRSDASLLSALLPIKNSPWGTLTNSIPPKVQVFTLAGGGVKVAPEYSGGELPYALLYTRTRLDRLSLPVLEPGQRIAFDYRTVQFNGSTSQAVTIFVPPNDPDALAWAILRVIEDADLARSLRQASLARVKDFSMESTAAANLAHPLGLKELGERLHLNAAYLSALINEAPVVSVRSE
ncbi:glycosyltransferase family 4 protein, partial [bacterium]|nr:glycosyltransferase family 4 protein [bacterium]